MTGKCLIKLSEEDKATAKTASSSMEEEDEEEEGVEVVADTDDEDDVEVVQSEVAVEVKQEITSVPEPVVVEAEVPKKKIVRKRTSKAASAEP